MVYQASNGTAVVGDQSFVTEEGLELVSSESLPQVSRTRAGCILSGSRGGALFGTRVSGLAIDRSLDDRVTSVHTAAERALGREDAAPMQGGMNESRKPHVGRLGRGL